MSEFLLDTNLLSDIGNRKPWWQKLAAKIDLYGRHRCFISAISAHEHSFGPENPVRGLSEGKRQALRALYGGYQVVDFDLAAAHASTQVRLHTPKNMHYPDTLIAGHALSRDMILVTGNEAHFRDVPGLSVKNWRA